MATMEKPKPKMEMPAAAPKKKTAEEAVQELEQRLAMLGGPSAPATAAPEDDAFGFAAPAAPPTPHAPPMEEAKPDIKGGKNALLARIMAAQNKAKETAPPPPIDLLGPPPPISQAPPPPKMAAPPPAYDSGLLLGPPPTEHQAPPPSFDAIEDNFMLEQPPPPQYAAAPPAASAPSFEDVLGGSQFVPAPPPQQFVPAPPPQEFAPPPVSAEEEMIMGMEGLSDQERRALLEEQRQIMEQIEREKNANASAIASAQADNFDMRSTSNAVNAISNRNSRTETGSKVNLGGGQEVALHGPERTKEAIKDGTAILVQCVNCENWMQVTGNATLMYCPVCAVVSPIDQNTASMTKEEAMQMEADRKLAESLQSEEYEQADRPRRQARPQAARPPQQQDESWWDTVTNMFSGETSTEDQPSPAERQGAANSARSSGGGSGSGRPAARVAQSQPLFSCVVDSVNSTVGTLTGAQLGQDAEGNVHGVDASSLLAVSNVGRDTEYSRMDNN